MWGNDCGVLFKDKKQAGISGKTSKGGGGQRPSLFAPRENLFIGIALSTASKKLVCTKEDFRNWLLIFFLGPTFKILEILSLMFPKVQ